MQPNRSSSPLLIKTVAPRHHAIIADMANLPGPTRESSLVQKRVENLALDATELPRHDQR
jgi:hypothetical protein